MLNSINQALITALLIIIFAGFFILLIGYTAEVGILKSCNESNSFTNIYGKTYTCYRDEK